MDETEWDDIIREHEEEQRLSQAPASSPPQPTPMSQLKSQLSKPLMDLKNTSQPYTATPISSPTPTIGVGQIYSRTLYYAVCNIHFWVKIA